MKKSIAIIGGGASALFLAAFLDTSKFDVTIYEQNKSLGRKFLVAGNGGFNLTHSESIDQLVERLTPSDFLKEALLHFDNIAFQKWLETIGIPTFVGSSKRIYPTKGIKPIEVLNTILAVLEQKKVLLKTDHTWMGWTEKGELLFNSTITTKTDYCVFTLGGGSWKVTGSDGSWLPYFKEKEINSIPFQGSNCAFAISWNPDFIQQHEGTPLKNLSIRCQNKVQKGEAVLTKLGLEGNAIYGLSPQIRGELRQSDTANIYLDLKSMLSEDRIIEKIEGSPFNNISQILRKTVKLSAAQVALLKTQLSKSDFLDSKKLAHHIKNFKLIVTHTSPIDEAISTVGGIDRAEVDANFQLNKLENHFCIGEMLDWDAPTGGYLLQACCSMGVYLANHLNDSKSS